MKLFAIQQSYDSGWGSHADMSRIVLLWAETPEAALERAKTLEEHETGAYLYEVGEIDPQPMGEIRYLFYQFK